MSRLTYRAQPATDDQRLADDWLGLTHAGITSPFIAWPWVSTWLTTLADSAQVVRVYDGDLLVAIALVTQRPHRHRGGFRSRALHLNHSGDEALDQIWPEYNGFMVKAGYEAAVYTSCLAGLQAAVDGWDEFWTGVMRDGRVESINQRAGFLVHTLWEAPTYAVDLTALREQDKTYLSSLSRSTRYQIRQSQRKLEALGQLTFTSESEPGAVLKGFERIGPFHRQDWGQHSGYLNPHFVRFHQALIQAPEAKGLARVHTAWLDNRPVASLYNLHFGNRAFFYLGFADKTLDKTIRPGLVLHARQIQQALDQGNLEYDFMGGDMQYKRQLGERTGRLVNARLKQPVMKFQVEQSLRRVKQHLTAVRENWRARVTA